MPTLLQINYLHFKKGLHFLLLSLTWGELCNYTYFNWNRKQRMSLRNQRRSETISWNKAFTGWWAETASSIPNCISVIGKWLPRQGLHSSVSLASCGAMRLVLANEMKAGVEHVPLWTKFQIFHLYTFFAFWNDQGCSYWTWQHHKIEEDCILESSFRELPTTTDYPETSTGFCVMEKQIFIMLSH